MLWGHTRGWTHRVVGEEVLLCDADGDVFTLEGASTPVFVVLESPGTVEQIVRRVAQRWPARPIDADAAAHATTLLVERGIVEAADDDHRTGAVEVERRWGVTEDGESIEVAVAAHLTAELARRWPPLGLVEHGRPPDPSRPPLGRIGLGRSGLVAPDDRAELALHPDEVAWGLLEQTLTAVAAEHLSHLVAIHSAVIAWNGSVLLVPATSGAGKSTIAMAAHRAGAQVLSDEYALVDPDTGLVTGWRRPLRIRRPDGSGEDRVDVAMGSDPLPVGLVAAVTYEPGSSPVWSAMTAAETTLELLAHTIAARSRPDAAMDAALAVSRRADAIKGPRGEADRALLDLLAVLDRQRSGPAPRSGG